MNISESLPVGTVVKLKEAEKRVVIMGILQQLQERNETKTFDYIGVPYPEGYLSAESTVLFQQTDIDVVFSIGFADIERQTFIADMIKELDGDNAKNPS